MGIVKDNFLVSSYPTSDVVYSFLPEQKLVRNFPLISLILLMSSHCFFLGGSSPMAGRSSWARVQTYATAAAQADAMIMLNP